jgi:hypothetical protein
MALFLPYHNTDGSCKERRVTMTRFVIPITLLVVLAASVSAQVPDQLWTYSVFSVAGSNVSDIIELSGCGYAAAGSWYQLAFPIGHNDAMLVRLNSSGQALWSRTYGSTTNSEGIRAVRPCPEGFALAGNTSEANGDFWQLFVNASGDSLRTQRHGGTNIEACRAMERTLDGGYILVGSTYSFGTGTPNGWAIKTSWYGDSLWSHSYGTEYEDELWAVQQTADSGYALAGIRGIGGPSNQDGWLIRTNSGGDTLWTRAYGSNDYEGFRAMDLTSDGGFVLAGYKALASDGHSHMWLVRTDASGDTLWTRQYGGPNYEDCYAVEQTSDGGFILAGWTSSFGAGNYDWWLVRVNADGDSLWSTTFGDNTQDQAWAVRQTSDSSFVATGLKSMSQPWIVKYGYRLPRLQSITDVGNDQGRQVRLRWERNSFDAACDTITITGYSIFRRIDQYRQANAHRAQRATLDWPPGEWEFISTVPARGEQHYAAIAPTLADSTSEGIYWSVFFVSAETPNPLVYFDSAPDSGYSKDNLPPDETLVTAMFQVTPQGILLNWEPVETGGEGQPEHGEIWYKVYGSTNVSFVCGPSTLLGTTQETHFLHDPGTSTRFYYAVRVSDDH